MQLHDRQPLHVHDAAHPVGGYVLAAAGAVVAVLAAASFEHWFGLDDLSLVFMLAVLVVATRTQTGPAVLTAVLCFLAYNYFFMEPRYTFYIAARQGVVTVALFLAAALLAGRLASRLAMQVHALQAANRDATARQELGHRLAVAADEDDVVGAANAIFENYLDAHVWIRLGDRGLHADGIEPPALAVLRRIDGLADGSSHAETIEEHGWWFLPLHAPGNTLGVVGLKLPAYSEHLAQNRRRLARAMVDDIAQALLRVRLVADLQSERVSNETERLRSALLSSVSHDLRTPLAAIIGAAGSLDSYGDAMDDDDRHALLDMIRTEGERLDRHIQNLLDMTRLGHGTLVPDRDWIGVDELIGSAVSRLQRYRPDVHVRIAVHADVGPIRVHPALVEQAIFNVLENAAIFSPPDDAIVVDARRTRDTLTIDVRDRGPGIPEQERSRIFDMFYRVERGDRGNRGSGLGLAICRGVVVAHGGTVEAFAGDDDRGTVIRITLPIGESLPDAPP